MEDSEILSDLSKERLMDALKCNKKDFGVWPREKSRDAATFVPLVLVEGKPSVLFTLRSGQLSRHRNQVSFPGGLADSGDTLPEDTALRELKEELGVESHDVDVWGYLSSLPDKRDTSRIVPVIGHIRNYSPGTLRINHLEVQQVFTLPIRHLAHPSNCRYTVLKNPPLKFPVFLGGPRRIWGLTAFMLDTTLMYLLPRKLYQPITTFP